VADISDVMDGLQAIALQAVFPNGTAQPSILPTKPPQVAQGWPLAKDLDLMMGQGRSIVSIYAVPSSSSDVPQPFIGTSQPLTPPAHGLAATITGSSVAITGSSLSAEYVTVFVAGKVYSAVGRVGSDGSDIAASLAGQIGADFPGTTATGSTVQVATNQIVEAIVGAPGTVVDRIHRQRLQFRIVVWSPNPADRAAIGRAIDVAVKQNLTFRLADTSQALMTYQGTNLDDKFENEGTYRRDLMVNVIFDTTILFDGYEVTAVIPPVTQMPAPQDDSLSP
jgi:hypothetical protein